MHPSRFNLLIFLSLAAPYLSLAAPPFHTSQSTNSNVSQFKTGVVSVILGLGTVAATTGILDRILRRRKKRITPDEPTTRYTQLGPEDWLGEIPQSWYSMNPEDLTREFPEIGL